MTLKNLKTRLLANKVFRNAYEQKNEKELAVRVGSRVHSLRIFMGLTQAQLAEMVKTQQPNIARIESGKKLPSLKTMHKLAICAGTYLIEPDFAVLRDNNKGSKINQLSVVHTNLVFAQTLTWYSDTDIPQYVYDVKASDSKQFVLQVCK